MSRTLVYGCAHSSRMNEVGFSPFYQRNSVNHCPGCGQAQWYVGRMSAECAFCGTALPLQDIVSRESRPVRHLDVDHAETPASQPA